MCSTERFGWLEQIVVGHELYIPKPAELNDPKEARPTIAPGGYQSVPPRFWPILLRQVQIHATSVKLPSVFLCLIVKADQK